MKLRRLLLPLLTFVSCAAMQAQVSYEGKDGPGKGKKVVLLAGDEEYRSEEVMPMLAKILSERHGFTCTVVWSINPPGWSEREIKDFKKANKDAPEPKPGDADPNDGTIDPNEPSNLPGMEALKDADACIMLWRFRSPKEELMKHFVDYVNAGKPVIGLRTSTHAFSGVKAPYQKFNGFGKDVLGEGWVSHWGRHKSEATLGILEESAKPNPLLRGITELFGDSDVYEASPPADAVILARGQVLKGMTRDSGAADYLKKTKNGEMPVNNPMQPIVWTREVKNDAGTTNKILCSTLGAATDMKDEALRRLVVNAVYAHTGLEVPEKANVEIVGDFPATMYGFGTFVKGKRPADYR